MEIPRPKKGWHWAWIFLVTAVTLAWISRPDVQSLKFLNTTVEDLDLKRTPPRWKTLELVTKMAKSRCEGTNLLFAHQFVVGERLSDRAFYYCSEGWFGSPTVQNLGGKIWCREEYAGVVKTTSRFKTVNLTFTQFGSKKTLPYTDIHACEVQFAVAILNKQW